MFFRREFFGNFLFLLQYSLVYIVPISIRYQVCRCMLITHGLYILEWRLEAYRQMLMFSFDYSSTRSKERPSNRLLKYLIDPIPNIYV